MSSLTIATDRASVDIAPAVSLGEVVPAQAQTATVLTHALQLDRKFADTVEIRGKDPRPTGLIGRFFNLQPSWAPILGGVAAAVSAVPFYLAHGEAGLERAAAAGGVVFLLSGFVGLIGLGSDTATPTSVLAHMRSLEPKHLAFIGDTSQASHLEHATLAALAERWLKRIDRQKIFGDDAHAALERLVAKGKTLPAEAHQQAALVMEMRDAMHDYFTGNLRRSLGDDQVDALVKAFKALPQEERTAAAPYLLKLYFKGERPRVSIESHEGTRKLYRALRHHDQEST